jgi:hypothetical protein
VNRAAQVSGYPYGEISAQVWAGEFKRLNPNADEELMTVWFANAIMTGYDRARISDLATDPATPRSPFRREAAARFVATAWIADILADDVLRRTGMSHPVSLVLAALDGETDPVQLGLFPKWHAGFRAVLAASSTEPDVEPAHEGDAGKCPTCGTRTCIGRLQYENCTEEFKGE